LISQVSAYLLPSFIRPRIYGSTEMNSLRTRTSSTPKAGNSTSTDSKLSWLTSPCGRETKWICVLSILTLRIHCAGVVGDNFVYIVDLHFFCHTGIIAFAVIGVETCTSSDSGMSGIDSGF